MIGAAQWVFELGCGQTIWDFEGSQTLGPLNPLEVEAFAEVTPLFSSRLRQVVASCSCLETWFR